MCKEKESQKRMYLISACNFFVKSFYVPLQNNHHTGEIVLGLNYYNNL